VYFVWTTTPDTFTIRNFKVLDSYLYHHPRATLIVYASFLKQDMFQPYITAGYNIQVRQLNDSFLLQLADRGCPGKSWLNKLNLHKRGPFFYSHVTDFVRFCVLYLEGGIYSDFDAILLNRISEHESFIGRDSSGALGKCQWCLPGGDLYLAPGLMGAHKGAEIPHRALDIAFEKEAYDPTIFNLVGPIAVTKAYREILSGIHVYDRHVLYPYNHMDAWKLLKENVDAQGIVNALSRSSLSLHLYGHKTRHLPVEEPSIASIALAQFSIVDHEAFFKTFEASLKCPGYFATGKYAHHVKDIRVVFRSNPNSDEIQHPQKTEIILTAKHGYIQSMEDDATFRNSKSVLLEGTTPAELNQKLSRLVYFPSLSCTSECYGKDTLLLKMRQAGQTIDSCTVNVYDITSLVTIIVKTFGRMEKVFTLIESVRELYPNVQILVADDGEQLVSPPSNPVGFKYFALPYDVGLSAGRNFLVDKVNTKYFLTLDDDFTMDHKSYLDDLVHALESNHFDIAAGKSPTDIENFELDFCGLMSIQNQTLVLEPGEYGMYETCHHVDFVPNLFVSKTHLFRTRIQWDNRFKLGEHEDFFLRAKQLGLRVGTCPSTSFIHDQVEHWLKRTKYDQMRNRVYDFWKDSLRKHGLQKLVSFNRTMMNLEGLLMLWLCWV
jgi:GT2 family glycosyltransferase